MVIFQNKWLLVCEICYATMVVFYFILFPKVKREFCFMSLPLDELVINALLIASFFSFFFPKWFKICFFSVL
jgi:hypothetical protein